MNRYVFSMVLTLGLAGTASAQNADIVIPLDRNTSIDRGCQVTGLDPNGDGFLALRAGPGTNFEQIGSLHNGDSAYLAASPRGKWLYVENGAIDGRGAVFKGWIYDAWCSFYP